MAKNLIPKLYTDTTQLDHSMKGHVAWQIEEGLNVKDMEISFSSLQGSTFVYIPNLKSLDWAYLFSPVFKWHPRQFLYNPKACRGGNANLEFGYMVTYEKGINKTHEAKTHLVASSKFDISAYRAMQEYDTEVPAILTHLHPVDWDNFKVPALQEVYPRVPLIFKNKLPKKTIKANPYTSWLEGKPYAKLTPVGGAFLGDEALMLWKDQKGNIKFWSKAHKFTGEDVLYISSENPQLMTYNTTPITWFSIKIEDDTLAYSLNQVLKHVKENIISPAAKML